jgi:NTE family protein
MKIGISLSGGGARGVAHLGVLQALQEMDIRPHLLAGVSAGAMVGAMYAQGYSPKEILPIVMKLKVSNFLQPSAFRKPGWFNLEKMDKILRQYIPHNSFENLQIPLTVSATDVNLGETIYYSEGELIKPIIASACVPVLFSPVHFQNRILVDGGIINSLIYEPLSTNCQIKIGVHTNPFDKNYPIKSTRGLLARCLSLAIHSNARTNFSKFDLVIEPSALSRFSAVHLSKAKQIYDIGYKAVWDIRKDIEALLKKNS